MQQNLLPALQLLAKDLKKTFLKGILQYNQAVKRTAIVTLVLAVTSAIAIILVATVTSAESITSAAPLSKVSLLTSSTPANDTSHHGNNRLVRAIKELSDCIRFSVLEADFQMLDDDIEAIHKKTAALFIQIRLTAPETNLKAALENATRQILL